MTWMSWVMNMGFLCIEWRQTRVSSFLSELQGAKVSNYVSIRCISVSPQTNSCMHKPVNGYFLSKILKFWKTEIKIHFLTCSFWVIWYLRSFSIWKFMNVKLLLLFKNIFHWNKSVKKQKQKKPTQNWSLQMITSVENRKIRLWIKLHLFTVLMWYSVTSICIASLR